MLGAIIGDIIGSPYEFNNIKTTEFPLFSGKSHFTDDTVMTLAIAQALINVMPVKGDKFSDEDFEKKVIEMMQFFGHKFPYAGYGGKFVKWLSTWSNEPYNSYGNGSAMRVSPVAWAFDSLDEVEKFAAISARVTHNHPEGIKGAQATAGAIFLARTGHKKSEIKNYVEKSYDYNLNMTLDEIRPVYKFNATCQGSVPEAIIAFLEGENFEDVIRKAVSIGGDSDTIAAIAGSIAQGIYEIPSEIENTALDLLGKNLIGLKDNFLVLVLENWEFWCK